MGESRSTAAAPRATLGRCRRLPNKAAFDAVLRSPVVRLKVGRFWLAAGPNGCCAARLGVAVAKRVLRRAAMRNRAKRMIRESFRQTELPPWDIVVGVAHGAADINLSDARQLFHRATVRFVAASSSKATHGH